jgi:hypothetical protein
LDEELREAEEDAAIKALAVVNAMEKPSSRGNNSRR